MTRRRTCFAAALLLLLAAVPPAASGGADRYWDAKHPSFDYENADWFVGQNWDATAPLSTSDHLIVTSGVHPLLEYINYEVVWTEPLFRIIRADQDIVTENGGWITLSSPTVVVDCDYDVLVAPQGQARMDVFDGASLKNHASEIGRDAGSEGQVTISGGSIWTISNTLTVAVEGTGSLSIQDGGVVSDLYASIGTVAGSAGDVTVSGPASTWSNTSGLLVGEEGSGSLSIQDGGAVSSDAYGIVGALAGSAGDVTVSGSASTWSNTNALTIAQDGRGTLTILDGGTVSNSLGYIGSLANSSGEVIVQGVGSTWENTSTLYVGRFGVGSLTVSDRGHVSNTTGYVGGYSGGTGNVTVRGAGSSWENGYYLFLGREGTGTLSIFDGGEVTNAEAGLVGWADGAVGTVLVSGAGSTWSCGSKNLYLGGGVWNNGTSNEFGGTGAGTLQVTSGGSVINSNGYLGYNAGATGDATVSGLGSTWANNGVLCVGQYGNGSLLIADGGAVSNSAGYVGRFAGSEGKANVRGAGSTWANSSSLYIGWEGTGSLAIEDGAAVTNGTGLIGFELDSVGEVSVRGAGSTWTSGDLYVGRDGIGALTIDEGGFVSSGSGLVGYETSSSGNVVVSGVGSSWINSAQMTVGVWGDGSLTIEDGGTVSNTSGDVGYNVGSSSQVVVSGAGATWTNSERLTIGTRGVGRLTITEGGAVRVADTLTVGSFEGSSGTVTLRGGSLTARVLAKGQGAATFDWTGGSLVITSLAGLTLDDGGLLGTNVTVAPGMGLQVDAETTVESGVLLDVSGGTFSTKTLAVAAGGQALLRGGAVAIGDTFVVDPGGVLEIARQDFVLAKAPTLEGRLTLDRATLDVPSLDVSSPSGTASLEITGGGAVQTRLSGVAGTGYVGNHLGAAGQVTVSGVGSDWTVNSNLFVGNEGTGSLVVEDGARVSNSIGFAGYFADGSGEVTVRGAGSNWDNREHIGVGIWGDGSLTIDRGAAVSNTSAIVGYNAGATGTVVVRGAGSVWTNSSDLTVGTRGVGGLSITDGGAVSNTYGFIGYAEGSQGTVTVAGGGAIWTNSQRLYVGAVAGVGGAETGTGTLTIGDGGSVDVAGLLVIAEAGPSTGTVRLEGGALSAEGIVAGGGAAKFNWTGGTLTITGPGGLALDGGLLGPVVGVTANKGLSVSGPTWVAPGVKLAVAGGSFATEMLGVWGKAQLRGGAIAIGDTFMVAGSGGELELADQDLVLLNAPTLEGNLVLDQTTLSVPWMTVGSQAIVDFNSGGISADGVVVNQNVLRMGSTGPASLRADVFANEGLLMGRGSIQAPLFNVGTMALSGDSTFSGDVTNQPGGRIIVSGRSAVTFFEDVDNQAGEEFRVSEGSTVTFFGRLSGDGITGTGTVYEEGDMRPGASPGVMDFEGTVVFGASAGLEVELAGTAPGDYDAVHVDHDATLNGTLGLSFVAPSGGGGTFTPVAGDTFEILTYGSRDGVFDTVTSPTFDGVNKLSLHYGDSHTVAIAGEWEATGEDLAGIFDVFDADSSLTVSGGWDWSGLAEKRGVGDLVLDLQSGLSTEPTAALAVEEGTFHLEGNGQTLVLSELTVDEAGTLSGTGTIAVDTIVIGGTLSPGGPSSPTLGRALLPTSAGRDDGFVSSADGVASVPEPATWLSFALAVLLATLYWIGSGHFFSVPPCPAVIRGTVAHIRGRKALTRICLHDEVRDDGRELAH